MSTAHHNILCSLADVTVNRADFVDRLSVLQSSLTSVSDSGNYTCSVFSSAGSSSSTVTVNVIGA